MDHIEITENGRKSNPPGEMVVKASRNKITVIEYIHNALVICAASQPQILIRQRPTQDKKSNGTE